MSPSAMTDSSSTSTEPRSVRSGGRAAGRLRPPSSKSLTQRFYNLALIASGPTTVRRPLRSEDCDHFLAGLRSAGCAVDDRKDAVDDRKDAVDDRKDQVSVVPPTGLGSGSIFCGASGTMMRFLTATLCTLEGDWRLDGAPRLRDRPLRPLLEALASLGAEVGSLERSGCPPLRIRGGSFAGGRCRLAASESSQFVSALLMAGAASPDGVTLQVKGLVSAPYVGLTEHAMALFGVHVEHGHRGQYRVAPGRPAGATVTVEADLSAACYPAAAAALTGGDVTIEGVERESAQGDLRFFDLLADMGARIDWVSGGVRVRGGRQLRAVEADMSAMPDQVPTVAALAPFAIGTTRLENVAHLRGKESDRLTTVATELRRLGATVVEGESGLSISGTWSRSTPPSSAVTTQSHDDHRIAMSCALVGLRRAGVAVADPGVVAKSYPGFWRDLDRLTA